jgi:hypothetical protein
VKNITPPKAVVVIEVNTVFFGAFSTTPYPRSVFKHASSELDVWTYYLRIQIVHQRYAIQAFARDAYIL